MVFGSDDERALINAFRASFPAAEHVYCVRHIQENACRYMTDTAGVPVSAHSEVKVSQYPSLTTSAGQLAEKKICGHQVLLILATSKLSI